MPEIAQAFVLQHVLDALGRWAKRASGVSVQHAEQNASKPTPPYISLEWVEELAPAQPKVEYEVSDAPTSATFTVSAAAGAWAGLVINMARSSLSRGDAEPLTTFTDRLMAEARAQLTGRLVGVRVGVDQIVVTPVVAGDLYRAEVVTGASVVVTGAVPARVVERLYRGTVRVWCIGASTTSGQAGTAGLGLTTAELLSSLTEGLERPWCQELFDSFLMRRRSEPRLAPARGRRLGAKREPRSYFDLDLGVTARFTLAAEAVISVPFAVTSVAPADSDEAPPASLNIEAQTGDTLEI